MVNENIINKLKETPVLFQFATWLSEKKYYSDNEIEELLCKDWDELYPGNALRDSVLNDLFIFLYNMGQYAVEETIGEDWWEQDIRIVPVPSDDDSSKIYILNLRTRSILAYVDVGKTWTFTPKRIEREIIHLLNELGQYTGCLESLSDKELIERFKSLYHIVKIVECYSARDVLELIKIENELIKRGYTFREKIPDVVKEDIEWK